MAKINGGAKLPRPFIVFALPRSRTAWTAHWLSGASRWVGHDIGVECRTYEDFLVPFKSGMGGTVETGAMRAWRIIKRDMPEVKFAVVRRPIWQVLHSLARFGLFPDADEMIERDEVLDELAEEPDVMSVRFEELGIPKKARELWIHLWGPKGPHWNPVWHEKLNAVNIQVNMDQRIDQLRRNADQLVALRAQVKGEVECLGNC